MASLGIIKGVTESILGVGEVSVDDFTFQLFYKFSASFFVASSFIVGMHQYFGDPIHCEISIDDDYWTEDFGDEDMFNTYCWMYGHLNLPHEYMGHCTRKQPDKSILYNTYYQWVSIFLMAQAFLFYLPRMIWLSMEGGLMAFLCEGCSDRDVEQSSEKEKKLLANFLEFVHNKFNAYTYIFFICELLNIVISVSQFFATDAFLGNQFYYYGIDIFNYYRLPPEVRDLNSTFNPMCEIFPRVGNCMVNRYNRGGGQQTGNAICILALNMINDKVFAFCWYLHMVLILASIHRVLLRTVQIFSCDVRYFMMKMTMYKYLTNNKHINHIKYYLRNCSIGDWLLLYQMNKNMNKRFFAEFLALLSLKVNPDPDVACDPEVDIDKNQQEEDANYFDEDDLENMQQRLQRKKAWRRKINFFTGKRRLGKVGKRSTTRKPSTFNQPNQSSQPSQPSQPVG